MNDDSIENNNYSTIKEGQDPENPKVELNNSSENTNNSTSDEKTTSNKIKESATKAAVSVKTFFKKAITGEDSDGATPEQENENDCRHKAMKYMQEKVEVEVNYKIFFMVISIGSALFCLSLFFLPMVIISPRKFVSLFSLGSLLILCSFLFFYGTKNYVEKLCSRQRIAFTTLFFGSLILGIFCAILNRYFFLSLICAGVQLISLVVFVLSFIPGGQHGISAIGSMVTAPARSLWRKISGSSS